MRKVGVLLCGCGVYDGSDALETALVLLALERAGLRPVPIAPDVEQREVVDHTSGDADPSAAPRRVILEAARLTRGSVRAVAEISPGELCALIVPGGMGVVKNLCSSDGGSLGVGDLRPEIAAFLKGLRERGAPLAFIGLARVLSDRLEGAALSSAALALAPGEIEADEARGTLFTPGFMGGDSMSEVAAGIERLVQELSRRLRSLRVLSSPSPSGAPR